MQVKTRLFRAFAAVAALAIPSAVLAAVPAAAVTCPCSFFSGGSSPTTANDPDTQSVEVGMKFTADTAGTASAIRFYKGSKNTGTHTGHLWTSSGSLLATVTFANETTSGWQQANLSTPVNIAANTTYVVSYRAPKGHYSVNENYFTTAKDNPPLHTPVGAGVYKYGTNVFPNQTYQSSNYWVDVVFSSVSTTAPTVTAKTPAANATDVGTASAVTATFSKPLNSATVNTSTVLLNNGSVAGSVAYDSATNTATLTPASPLAYSTTYTATVKGGADGIKDVDGNALAGDATWTFTTAANPAPVLPPQKEPILLVTTSTNPFSSYYTEILKGEGLNEYAIADINAITKDELGAHRAVVLGETSLTDAQVALLTEYVNNGGQLIAMRPDKKLAPLLGLSDASATLSDQYVKLSSTSRVTAGITQDTMQFHGTADDYSLNGAMSLATLYANASTSTTFPAVTVKAVGAWGGQAAAFTYDLAKSVVYTRQGNPAWAGQNRDGDLLKRSDDLFFGNAANDPQADWVNLAKVQIPQADEQQHVLSNLLTQMTASTQPMPKFWFLPNGKKAAVIETGDDHGNNGTAGRFAQFDALSPAGCNVANWECVRSTSYVYPGTPLSQSDAENYTNKGFEVATHVSSNCADWTPADLQTDYANDLTAFHNAFPTMPAPVTNRLHCIDWSDWDTQAHVEQANGIRLDTNYYYYPDFWVKDQPGLFTGSGQLLKFADADGTLVDVYQAATQLTDESGQSYPYNPVTLLDNAVGDKGYYAIITANHHTDQATENQSTTTVAAAQARGIPVVSAKQMLTWLDGRNASTFTNLTWANNTLSFNVNVGSGAENLIRGMVPVRSATGVLSTLTSNGIAVPYTVDTIKGVEYAFFASGTATYTATYVPDTAAPTITSTTPAGNATDVQPNAPVFATASEALDPATVNSSTVTLTANGSPVAGTVSYNAAAKSATFVPAAQLALSTTFTLTVTGGSNGVKDLAGNALATNSVTTFTTAAFTTSTIFPASVVPNTPSYPDAAAYTLGVKFQSTADGYITGIRFYKGANNTGTHVGALWNASGQVLASGTFGNETATGWQTLTFTDPVPITAGITYTAGYLAPNGGYAADTNGLATQQGSGTLHSLVGGGVYAGGGTLTVPTNAASNNMNYYVDAIYQSRLGADTTPPVVTGTTPASNATTVPVSSSVSATVSEALDPASVNGSSLTIPGVSGAVAYDNSSHTVTLTPSTALTSNTTYTATLSGVKDIAGNALAVPYSWSFTTAATAASNLFGNAIPANASASDTAGVELGVRFTSDTNGFITGIRFYKGANNTGTHVGNLWSSTGTLLATGTFDNETATGWQTMTFSSPVAVTANTTYVASYFAPVGGYAYDSAYFNVAKDAAPLHAPAGNNGVYIYGSSSAFPTNSYNNTNYWVDVTFAP